MTNNTDTKSTPATPAPRRRITVREVDEDLQGHKGATAKAFAGLHTRADSLEGAQRATDSNLARVQSTINGQRHLISELQRKSQGSTRANAKVSQVESKLAQIESEVAALRKRSSNINTDAKDEVIAGAYSREFERINTRLTDFFNTLTAQDTTLQEELEALSGRVGVVESDIKEVRGEHNLLRHDHNELHERFTAFAKLRDAVPWGRIIVSLIVGVLAALWTFDFVLKQHTLQDGTVVQLPVVWFVTILVGLGVFGIVLGILHWIRSRNQQEAQQPQNTQVVREVSVNPNPVVHSSPAPAAEDAPTKVYTTQGASSGTR